MKFVAISLITVVCSSFVGATTSDTKVQKTLYKSWVLSRCLSAISSENDKQDYLNTASAYLERSNLPVEAFIKAEPLIKQLLGETYTGSIKGTFESKKCIDLFNSDELDSLYRSLN